MRRFTIEKFKIKVLDNVSFDISADEFVRIVGLEGFEETYISRR